MGFLSGIFEAMGSKNEKQEEVDAYSEYDDYDDSSERLSVWDAADIWRSKGCDEDYMFGYTEEELENA